MSAHHEWLSLVEVCGPFLAVPVLREAFPQGFEALEAAQAKRLRCTYEEWRDAVDTDDADLDRLHIAWIDEVFLTALEAGESMLRRGEHVPPSACADLPEHDTSIVPDLVLVDPTRSDAVLLLVHIFSPDTNLSAALRFRGLASSPADRMALHLRSVGCPLGIVTNGERWMLVHAPVGQVASFASWYARLWGQEPETLRAFESLLGLRRFFAPEEDRLPRLFERSLKHQDEVTEALGEQVRRAVEVLVQALDRADQDRNRELLHDVRPQDLYEAGLTVMMRLVFLLAAEERGLLLLGEPRYDAFYAVSTLRMQLRVEGDEILERRRSAWSRLLAVFRAVYGGIDHPTLRLPAMGGSLFDPDRFPFLEGRLAGTTWRRHPAEPLPIDDRTVLLLLDAIQLFDGRTLSYRALDVEQIGYVYEGLLERTVQRVGDVTLELVAGSQAKDPRVSLGELESARLDGQDAVVALLVDRSKRSESAVRNALAKVPDTRQAARLLAACRGDVRLRDRLHDCMGLLRTDPWGYPVVNAKGSFVVVLGADRRETGTHYTPKSLTVRIVEQTLTPLVYKGPAEGSSRDLWILKSPEEILALKVCDSTMGSGAFLVQACRFLAERLVEAWAISEDCGRGVDEVGKLRDPGEVYTPLTQHDEERLNSARMLVVERCLYGVDQNALAVELAKLSLWLTTLAKGKPFGFLDHNLRSGDSLLGIYRLEQLTQLSMNAGSRGQLRLFGQSIEQAVREAISLRTRLRGIAIRDINDVDNMAKLNADARSKLELSEHIADAFIDSVLASSGNDEALESTLSALALKADLALNGDRDEIASLQIRAVASVPTDPRIDIRPRKYFHWPLEYPEVFCSEAGGFDAVIGNPPFMGGKQMPTRIGPEYCEILKTLVTESKGAADLVAYFFRRAYDLIATNRYLGLLSTKSIAETASRSVGLDPILKEGGTVYFAMTGIPWPGQASVFVSVVLIAKGSYQGEKVLDGHYVSEINSSLNSIVDFGAMKRLQHGISYSEGVKLYGAAFIKTKQEVEEIRGRNPGLDKYLRRYVNGDVLNGTPDIDGGLFVIDFGDLDAHQIDGCADIVAELKFRVSQERLNQKRQIHEHRPWLHWDKRLVFMAAARKLPRVIACVIVQRHMVFEFVDPNNLYAHGIKLFADDRSSLFALLQSSIHEAWVRGASSKLGNSVRYSTSTSFDTFPIPDTALEQEELINIGDEYSRVRRDAAIGLGLGLTDLYNVFHDPKVVADRTRSLRDLHMNLDYAVAAAYGWRDLCLGHAFCQVPYLPDRDSVRFAISESARIEILRRLEGLNSRCYEEEQVSITKPSRLRSRKGHGKISSAEQASLPLLEAP